MTTKYNFTRKSLKLAVIPGSFVGIRCVVIAYPPPILTWKGPDGNTINPVNLNTTNFNMPNEAFTHTMSNLESTYEHNLYIKLTKPQLHGSYKCFLNGTILIKDYNISIIGKYCLILNSFKLFTELFLKFQDHKPIISLSLNKSQLNRLKLGVSINLTSQTPLSTELNKYDDKPIKYRISYHKYNSNAFTNQKVYDSMGKMQY